MPVARSHAGPVPALLAGQPAPSRLKPADTAHRRRDGLPRGLIYHVMSEYHLHVIFRKHYLRGRSAVFRRSSSCTS